MTNYLRTKLPQIQFIFIHFFAWVTLIGYELAALYFISGNLHGIKITLVYYLVHGLFFYVHALYILPLAFKGMYRLARLLLFISAELIACVTLKYLLDHLLLNFQIPKEPMAAGKYFILSGWRVVFFLILATAYWLIRRVFAEARERLRLKITVSELRYAFLQQQINPHFLFNSLNFIYSSVLKISPDAAMSVYYLSELTRYSIQTDNAESTVSLTAEEQQLKNVIALNQARFGNRLQVSYQLSGSLEGLTIVPYILLTFTENVFKHGNLLDGENPGTIQLSTDSVSFIKFTTWNLKKYQQQKMASNGIGLANARKRLDHVYRHRYSLEVTDLPESFALELTIML